MKAKTKTSTKQPFVIVRAYSSGVHAGYLVRHKLGEVVLRDSRRVWYWDGAASLSELSQRGANPQTSKIPCSVPLISIENVIEVIPCSKKAIEFFKTCPEWRKQ
jgi:hypothetical protein